MFGSFLDLETIFNVKSSLHAMGMSCSSSFCSDFNFLYFSSIRVKSLELYSLFLSLNIYIRTEIPLLNSRLRKSYNKIQSLFKFYTLGISSNYFTYPIKSISNNSYKSILFFRAKNIFSRFCLNPLNKLIIFFNNFYFLNNFFLNKINPVLFTTKTSVTDIALSHLGVSVFNRTNLFFEKFIL